MSIYGFFQDRKSSKKIAAETQERFDQIVEISTSEGWKKISCVRSEVDDHEL
jgi:hypothetical protein